MSYDSVFPPELVLKWEKLREYVAEGVDSREQLSEARLNDVKEVLVFLLYDFWDRREYTLRDLIMNLDYQLTRNPTRGNARYVVSRIDALLSSLESPRIGPVPIETGLERRITELENKIVKLRSAPVLETKVTKLEEDLRKLRVASEISSGSNNKEQVNLLEKYKTAERKAFVIMPFASVFDDVWKGGIEPACLTEGFGYLRVDKISLSS